MNCLKAIFWDYPEFTNPAHLKETIRKVQNEQMRLWFLKRFLEYGRVIDTWDYYSMEEISELFPVLRLSKSTSKKWKRMIEVYGNQGK